MNETSGVVVCFVVAAACLDGSGVPIVGGDVFVEGLHGLHGIEARVPHHQIRARLVQAQG